jgi:RHS repeat-associated protein
MTSDGTNTYSWDAENRLIQVIYPGVGNNSQFTFDALGKCVKIVETVSGSLTSTQQFVWCGNKKCEARDGSSSVLAQFFHRGEIISGTSYFYNLDHLGSIRELTNSAGAVKTRYGFDPYGQVTQTFVSGTVASDFQYAGYYFHAPSGLCLTRTRSYSAGLGRWITRDSVGELGGINLYGYCQNNPLSFIDPLGLCPGDNGYPQGQWYGPYGQPSTGGPYNFPPDVLGPNVVPPSLFIPQENPAQKMDKDRQMQPNYGIQPPQ